MNEKRKFKKILKEKIFLLKIRYKTLITGFLFFDKGRFPESQELVILPQPKIPDFVRTQIALSPIDLYIKFSSTNAKALVSIQAMAALHFYIDGDKDISREAMEEFLRNVTFQALTNESDRVVIAFDKIGFLVTDLLEQFVKIEQVLYKDSETLNKNLDKTINQTDFDIEVAPEVEIKEGVLKFQSREKKLPPEPKIKAMPLTTNEIEKNYEDEQKQYFETAITLNQTNIDTAIENAEESNKETILEMIDPTPGQIVIDTFNPNN